MLDLYKTELKLSKKTFDESLKHLLPAKNDKLSL